MDQVSYEYRHHIHGGEKEEKRSPKKIDTILIEYPNSRHYTYVKLGPARNTTTDSPAITGDVQAPTTTAAFSCKSDLDCSLNGKCETNHLCSCSAAWKGDRCSTLNFLPTTRDSGYRVMNNNTLGGNLSSWGGGGWYDEQDQKWYMWVSEMADHCGMHTWTTNSQTVRASSKTATGLYLRENVEFPIWSHESVVTVAPTGEYVAFFSYNPNEGPSRPVCNCTDGSTPSTCHKKAKVSAPMIENTDPTYMSYSTSPTGNWSKPVLVLGPTIVPKMTPMDTNMAAVILSNGSLVGMWRDHEPTGKSVPHLVTATNWKDAKTYVYSRDDLLFGKKKGKN